MKLIELLVQELPKRGGWPDGALCSTQSVIDGEVYFYDRTYDGQGCMPKMKGKILLSISEDVCMGCEGLYPVITREQYEAALAAAQQPVWDGEGLPPVGAECEIASSTQYLNISHPAGAIVKIYSHFTDDRGVELAAFVDAAGKVGGVCTSKCFRPIRSEAEKKRAEIIEEIAYHTSLDDARDLYEAIAAGQVKGVKLDV